METTWVIAAIFQVNDDKTRRDLQISKQEFSLTKWQNWIFLAHLKKNEAV